MTLRHYDDFNAAAGTSLGTKSYWTLKNGTWTEQGGYVQVTSSLNTDSVAQHDTDANLGWTNDFSIACSVFVDIGAKYAGIYCIGDATNWSTEKVVFRWREDFGQRWELQVPGVADQIVLAPGVWSYSTPTIHTLELKARYQQTIGTDPVYIFEGYADEVLVLTSPPIQMTHWTASTFHVGLVGRIESFGGANPQVQFHHIASDLPQTLSHEPEPRVTTEAARTPITISDETPNGSPATFPFKLRQVTISHRRSTRKMLVDAGWEWTSPRLSAVRRVFECNWVGGATDAATLRTFHAARKANYDNFQADIRAMGIGTVDVVFGSSTLEFQIIGHELYQTSFLLVELI